MVVRMAEDPKKEEAKEKLRFFKNGKDRATGEDPDQEGSAPQAVATEEATGGDAKRVSVPAAGRPVTDGGAFEAEEPRADAGEDGRSARETKPSADGTGTATEDDPAGDAPANGAPRARRRERVQAQESEPEAKETIMSQLLPSLALGFRTLVILAIITADAFAAYMLTTKVIAPRLIETKVVDLKAEIGQLPPRGGVLPKDRPAKPAMGQDAVGKMFQIKDIVVNPAGTNGTRYLCTTVALEITNPMVEEEAAAREAQVRDLLIEILGRRSVVELSSLEMRDLIREEIEDSVNALLSSGEIDGVYFSNFVLQ
jgi:flagellar basal body-associated protein FliL